MVSDPSVMPTLDGALMLLPARTDGYAYDMTTIQGVRTSDNSTSQWTTPDAYAGEVHDPASQRPFMWNRNNRYVYTDPSGYCFWDLCIAEGIGITEAVMIGATLVGSVVAGYELSNTVRDADLKRKQTEHSTNRQPKNLPKHEEGKARKAQDYGGEKGDDRRDQPRRPPPNHNGPWPPKPPNGQKSPNEKPADGNSEQDSK